MRTGVQLIGAERLRQVKIERFTALHDDSHKSKQLAKAAASYLAAHAYPDESSDYGENRPLSDWPWGAKWWKPSPDPVPNLVKAGALIAAEIDRLQRKKKCG